MADSRVIPKTTQAAKAPSTFALRRSLASAIRNDSRIGLVISTISSNITLKIALSSETNLSKQKKIIVDEILNVLSGHLGLGLKASYISKLYSESSELREKLSGDKGAIGLINLLTLPQGAAAIYTGISEGIKDTVQGGIILIGIGVAVAVIFSKAFFAEDGFSREIDKVANTVQREIKTQTKLAK